jgi:hypothetical protein
MKAGWAWHVTGGERLVKTIMVFGLEPGDLAGWAAVLFSLATSIVVVCVWFQLRQRERRIALTDLHLSITTGETAVARDVLGTLFYSPREGRDQPTRADAISSYFKLIWALQRARNVFHAYGFTWTTLDTSPSRLEAGRRRRGGEDAARIMSWNLIEMARNIVMFHDTYGIDWSIADEDAWNEMASYLNPDGIRLQFDRENEAATSS